MGIFGVVSQEARGHVITTILIGMFAMLLTAVSYGRMARVYPNAGSAFAYVGQELHPGLGYVTGWSMVMDYVLNPMICTIYCSKVAMTFIPGVPYAVWVAVFAAVFTMLNLRGVKASARTNEVLAIGMFVVVVLFVGAALRYLFSAPSRSGRFPSAVLRSGDLLIARRPHRRVNCVPDVHRLRRHFYTL